jgi:hypothetical protein
MSYLTVAVIVCATSCSIALVRFALEILFAAYVTVAIAEHCRIKYATFPHVVSIPPARLVGD